MAKPKGPRYWYAMQFREERDMLTAQLVEHAEWVHKFVIMEATVDHSGQPKPLNLEAHWDEFKPWHDQIEYVTADWLPSFEQNESYWYREQTQRDIGMPYLLGSVADGDIVIVSDVDEFVPQSAYGLAPAPTLALVQKLRYAAVDWDGSPGPTAVMARGAVLRNGQFTCDTLRQHREMFEQVSPGGYHFSWFGGPEQIRRKALCSPHQETLEANLALSRGYAWERGMGSIGPGVGNVAEITDDYPLLVQTRECPWYWWRPGPDGMPVDEEARAREVARRKGALTTEGTCAEGNLVRMAGGSAWHPEDGSPCPTAPM